MDGGDRLAKAWIAGATTIQAIRFQVDPPNRTLSSRMIGDSFTAPPGYQCTLGEGMDRTLEVSSMASLTTPRVVHVALVRRR